MNVIWVGCVVSFWIYDVEASTRENMSRDKREEEGRLDEDAEGWVIGWLVGLDPRIECV